MAVRVSAQITLVKTANPKLLAGRTCVRVFNSCCAITVVVLHREQRLTGILVFVLTGLSVFLAPVLQVS